MSRKIAIALATAGLLGAAAIPTDAMAFRGGGGGHGGFGGGFHGGFHGGGLSRGFGGHGFVGRGFGRGFYGPAIGLGLGLGYGASCYAWTPYGYQWVCGPYSYY